MSTMSFAATVLVEGLVRDGWRLAGGVLIQPNARDVSGTVPMLFRLGFRTAAPGMLCGIGGGAKDGRWIYAPELAVPWHQRGDSL